MNVFTGMWQLTQEAPLLSLRMMMVAGGVEAVVVVALRTQAIVRGQHPVAMRIVAIAAYHAGPGHFALQEGAIHIDFLFDLTIREI